VGAAEGDDPAAFAIPSFGGPWWMCYCLVHNIEKSLNFGESYAMAFA
jgi:hypothetical protein